MRPIKELGGSCSCNPRSFTLQQGAQLLQDIYHKPVYQRRGHQSFYQSTVLVASGW